MNTFLNTIILWFLSCLYLLVGFNLLSSKPRSGRCGKRDCPIQRSMLPQVGGKAISDGTTILKSLYLYIILSFDWTLFYFFFLFWFFYCIVQGSMPYYVINFIFIKNSVLPYYYIIWHSDTYSYFKILCLCGLEFFELPIFEKQLKKLSYIV